MFLHEKRRFLAGGMYISSRFITYIYIMKNFVNYFARAGLGGMNGLNPC